MSDRNAEDRSAQHAAAINAIRALAMDAPNAARSGHQGTAMALAPIAHVLWSRILRFDPSAPDWADRDRFVLSGGHASILLYSMLHLTGYAVSLEDLMRFRQWGSITPGHPEAGHTPGVEVTTGPLGQGIANAVGMAIAEEHLRARLGEDLCSHHVFAMCGDGDLQEGISHEAASLAGHLGLGRLVLIFDDNRITIDGPTSASGSDDTAARFESYGWHVVDIGDSSEDLDKIADALVTCRDHFAAPSLLMVRTHAGYPSPTFTDSPAAHGLPFDDAAITETKAEMGVVDEPFHIPDGAYDVYREAAKRGRAEREAHQGRVAATEPERRELFEQAQTFDLVPELAELPTFDAGDRVATRKAFNKALNSLGSSPKPIICGSADLASSTGAKLDEADRFSAANGDQPQVFYGVREHAMAAAMVGMARHGGVLPFGGTFLVFSDYCRPSLRLAAMSGAKVGFVFSHDSIGVGEDGPTHQPIEQIEGLRAIPDLDVIRPADANETAAAMAHFLNTPRPAAFVLSRQDLPVVTPSDDHIERVAKGGYALVEDPEADLTLLAAGSEVALCLEAAESLRQQGVSPRVVSMPCREWFDAQPAQYRSALLPGDSPTLAVEAASGKSWYRYADAVIDLDSFGASAPGPEVMSKLGFNPENLTTIGMKLVEAATGSTSRRGIMCR